MFCRFAAVFVPTILALFMLSGCEQLNALGGPPVNPAIAPLPGEVTAHFVVGQDVNVIEVRALDPGALRSAVLIDPQGTRTPAYSIEIEPSPEESNYYGGSYSASGLQNLGGGMIPYAIRGQPQVTTTFIGQNASVALIRPTEPAAYLQSWAKSRIEVQLGDGAGARTVTIPAPEPI
jgi:hypothetical protein